MELKVSHLSWSAGGRKILNDVSLRFPGPGVFGILGPNGCGKTSLLRHIGRELPPHGTVFLDGRDAASFSRREFARRLAVLPQRLSDADDGLTVSEIVRLGRYPRLGMLKPYDESDEAAVQRALSETGLLGLAGRRLGTLSGGEAQRVMIAKCLAQEPEAIVLDEPTNHLDLRYRLELMELLKRFGGLIILTIHDLNLAADYCDRLFVMKDGRLLGEGSVQEVMEKKLLEEAFEVPFSRRLAWTAGVPSLSRLSP